MGLGITGELVSVSASGPDGSVIIIGITTDDGHRVELRNENGNSGDVDLLQRLLGRRVQTITAPNTDPMRSFESLQDAR